VTATPSPPILAERQNTTAESSARGTLFRCVLDEQPGYLAPSSTLHGGRRLSEKQLIVNPRCRCSWTTGTPDELAAAPAFLDLGHDDRVIWVFGPTGAHPFWVGDAYREFSSDCRPAAPIPAGLPQHAVMVLRQANVFVDKRQETSTTNRWRATASKSARAIRRYRYVNVSGLIHGFHVDALRKYYRRLVRNGGMCLGDGQSFRRYACHNEVVSRYFHHQLTDAISEIVGEKVKPSYTYVVSYQGGAELERHVDREQCEFTLSLLIDYPPERESQWPLCIESNGRTVELTQKIGDGLLFCGRELPHFRPKLPEGYTSTSVLLHYVREDFDGSLD
jgi:hypothetical protein